MGFVVRTLQTQNFAAIISIDCVLFYIDICEILSTYILDPVLIV